MTSNCVLVAGVCGGLWEGSPHISQTCIYFGGREVTG